MNMRWLVVLLVVPILLGAARAEAHPIDIGYLRIDVDGPALTTVLDLDIVAAGQLIRVEPDKLTADAVGAYESRLARATYRSTEIASEAGPCTWAPSGSIRRERRVVLLTAVATCPGGDPPRSLTWKLSFLDQLPSTFQVFLQAPAFGEQMPILDRAAPTLELHRTAPERGFFGAVWSGIARLRILDPLVLLLALLLAGGAQQRPPYGEPGTGGATDPAGEPRRELAGIAGAAFAAQAATCALAVAGILRPPAALIAPLVAASIIVAAFTAIAAVPHRRRRLAIELGCIHGVALAEAGREVGAGAGFYVGGALAYAVAALVLVPLLARRKATFLLGAAACAYASYLILVGLT